MTVEDDGGARATARCNVAISSADAPQVRLVRPQGVRATTQGEVIDVLVDARPGPGRDVVSTAILVDGVEVDTDEAAPYEMQLTVPVEAATGSTLRLVARAVDSRGDVGLSEATLLQVENDLPVPAFVAVPVDVREVHVDASAVRDDTTDPAALQVRWDFQDDGVWDTPFAVEKTADFVYPDDGEYTIRMQVRDNIGQVASTTRQVRFVDRLVAFGPIESQVWFGTVLVTGDVRVLPGHTLTIAAGTQVLFVYQDQNNDQIGDLTLQVNGRLLVQGEPENPVVFTPAEPGAAANRWDRILLAGDQPSLIEHAVIENANVGIEARDGSDFTGVSIRNMQENCMVLNGGADVALTDVTLSGCRDGLSVENTQRVVVTDSRILDNRERGLYVRGNGLTLATSRIAGNGTIGWHGDAGTHAIQGSTIERSGGDGVLQTRGSLQVQDSTFARNGGRGLNL
ncbi:MAG: right-handed parallel beta-helix repeat-containing protein, partial [bacterium]